MLFKDVLLLLEVDNPLRYRNEITTYYDLLDLLSNICIGIKQMKSVPPPLNGTKFVPLCDLKK